jgi:hypothetical protein
VRIARTIEIIIGLFFVVAAALKAADIPAFQVQIMNYGVVENPAILAPLAVFVTALETLLGALLITSLTLRGATWLATQLVLLGFTLLIAYAWAFEGLSDCGCLGSQIKMTPPQSIAKNLIMMAALGFAVMSRAASRLRQAEPETSPPPTRTKLRSLITAGLCMAVLITGLVFYKPKAEATGPVDANRPFAQFQLTVYDEPWDLGKDEYLVALLSATCDHCKESVPFLNEAQLQENAPLLIGLMWGSDEEIAEFEAETIPEFPLNPIDPVTFRQLVDSAPPRLSVVRDGVEVHAWEEEMPDMDTLVATFSDDT